jgi:hypothetical protein
MLHRSTRWHDARLLLLTRLAFALAVVATTVALSGCAILAGGAAGAATGYVAGKAAKD